MSGEKANRLVFYNSYRLHGNESLINKLGYPRWLRDNSGSFYDLRYEFDRGWVDAYSESR
ncbi:hypothetical protein ACFL5K_03795 [Gemmatimonadota bacterium]